MKLRCAVPEVLGHDQVGGNLRSDSIACRFLDSCGRCLRSGFPE